MIRLQSRNFSWSIIFLMTSYLYTGVLGEENYCLRNFPEFWEYWIQEFYKILHVNYRCYILQNRNGIVAMRKPTYATFELRMCRIQGNARMLMSLRPFKIPRSCKPPVIFRLMMTQNPFFWNSPILLVVSRYIAQLA